MTFFDQHMHSHFSFDSTEDPFNYISEDTKVLTLTEHFDFNNPYNHFNDDIPDFDAIIALQKEMKEKHGVKLLLGVETGYVPEYHNQIEALLSRYDFDHILLSCHHNNEFDFMDPKIKNQSYDPIEVYLKQLKTAISKNNYAQIFTHFDYGMRIHDMTVQELKNYESLLVDVFDAVIQKKLAFELNSKSMYKYGCYDLYLYAIPLYQSLGGKLFSLGSDAHEVADHFLNFNESIEILKHHNVEAVQVYQKKKQIDIPIDSLHF